MEHRIQSGIYFESGAKPPPAHRLLLLNTRPGTSGATLFTGIQEIITRLDDVRAGRPRELSNQPEELAIASRDLFAGLDVLIGYGRRFFDDRIHVPVLTREPRPEFLAYISQQSPFPSLPWAPGVTSNIGETDIVLQFSGPSQAAVSCAAVEVWKAIIDLDIPLEPMASFDGFGRVDGRGWLEFHDGVSNMDSSVRLEAIEARPDPEWMAGGTYLAFMRIIVDLVAWRNLSRRQQELLVGRDKLTGAALSGIAGTDQEGPVPAAREFPGPGANAEARSEWRDPPETTDPLIELSHVHRANQTRASPDAPGSLRMFRQGYEFLEGFTGGAPVLGLNFVSYQSDLRTIQQVLNLPGWLGDANFGGPAEDQDGDARTDFLSLAAAGFYCIPPRDPRFAGASLLATS